MIFVRSRQRTGSRAEIQHITIMLRCAGIRELKCGFFGIARSPLGQFPAEPIMAMHRCLGDRRKRLPKALDCKALKWRQIETVSREKAATWYSRGS
jgi:hypothetical protein